MNDTPAASSAPDARDLWTPFALHPIRLETPLGWHAIIANWAVRSAHVRWESLTSTPLDMNWVWEEGAKQASADVARKRVDEVWTREAEAAKKQAEAAKVEFEWRGDSRSPSTYCGLEAEGRVREYTWGGQRGALTVVSLEAEGRRAYLSITACPTASTADPVRVIKRVFRSLALTGADQPLRLCAGGVRLELPSEFRLENVRGQEGHLYLDLEAPGRRLGLARLGFSDWHLSGPQRDRIWPALAKVLFDRSEGQDPVTVSIESAAPSVWGRPPERRTDAQPAQVLEHEGLRFTERRGVHLRFGDWVMRHLARPYAGGATVLTWHCTASRALFALSARSGASGSEDLAREMARHVGCHQAVNTNGVDWAEYVAVEAALREGEKLPDLKQGPQPAVSPVIQRKMQLRFRVRALPEVRLECSSKDHTADLVYEAGAANGIVARLLRGGRAPERSWKRLAVDPLGRRAWEGLGDGPSVGMLLAAMSRDFAVHPVELFPKLLAFLKALGERRLVEGALDDLPDAEKTPAETAEAK